MGGCRLLLPGSEERHVAGSDENCNETLGSVKSGISWIAEHLRALFPMYLLKPFASYSANQSVI